MPLLCMEPGCTLPCKVLEVGPFLSHFVFEEGRILENRNIFLASIHSWYRKRVDTCNLLQRISRPVFDLPSWTVCVRLNHPFLHCILLQFINAMAFSSVIYIPVISLCCDILACKLPTGKSIWLHSVFLKPEIDNIIHK